MVKLFSVLRDFKPVRLLVIGDFMLDSYTRGKVKRISPEAPVPVLQVQKQEYLPGGAGNVALNLLSLGASVTVLGRIGEDTAGKQLRSILENEEVNIKGLFLQNEFQTPVKNRIIADSQQLLRIDYEDSFSSLNSSYEKLAKEKFLELIDATDSVAISDYGKGFLTKELLQFIIEESKKRGIDVFVDPKGDDFTKYSGATLIKPNLSEAYAAAKLSREASLEEVARAILAQTGTQMLLITRSEHGISLFHKNGQRQDFPVRSKEVLDVTGAGDTVLAMISMALANHLDIDDAAQLANIAAGIAIEKLGCARVNLADMSSRLLEFHGENKVFDEEHLFALQQVLNGKRVVLLGVDSKQGITSELFRTLHKISEKESDKTLIVYVRDEDPDHEFIVHLSSLSDVDFIILQCESLKNVCSLIHPQEVYSLENEGLIALQRATDLLSRIRRAGVSI